MSQINDGQNNTPGKKNMQNQDSATNKKHSRRNKTHDFTSSQVPDTTIEVREAEIVLQGEQHTQLSDLLKEILRQERMEITRVARVVGVTENTIYRWMNGSSSPRVSHLKRLLEALPEQHSRLSGAIARQYPAILDSSPSAVREIQKDIYERVIDLIVANEEPDTRLWQVAQAIFEYALLQLDSQRQGLAITLAQLMPPRADGIHSLREYMTRGNPPWPYESDIKLYLGNTTLAGLAIKSQRTRVWSINNNHQLAEIGEYEHSACSVPISRGGRSTNGVLTVSSPLPDFFDNTLHTGSAEVYAKLLSLALLDSDFYPLDQIKLRTMPNFKVQQQEILRTYMSRVLTHARVYDCTRRDAERFVQQQLETEFENIALLEQHKNKRGNEPL